MTDPEIQQLFNDHSVALRLIRELASWSTQGRADHLERDAILRARKWLHTVDDRVTRAATEPR